MYIITLQPVVGVLRHRGRGSRSSYTPQRQHAIAQTLYGFCTVNTTKNHQKNSGGWRLETIQTK